MDASVHTHTHRRRSKSFWYWNWAHSRRRGFENRRNDVNKGTEYISFVTEFMENKWRKYGEHKEHARFPLNAENNIRSRNADSLACWRWIADDRPQSPNDEIIEWRRCLFCIAFRADCGYFRFVRFVTHPSPLESQKTRKEFRISSEDNNANKWWTIDGKLCQCDNWLWHKAKNR